MSLFPVINPQLATGEHASGMYVEIEWDYNNDRPVFRNGIPSIIRGGDAVLVWAWNALNTPRFRHEIFTWTYGNECEGLIGQAFTEELKQAEAARYVRECLLINPYITDVIDIEVSFSEEKLSVTCTVNTVYGEASINV